MFRTFATKAPAAGALKDVVIASFARTPVGSFQGSLSSMKATQLGSVAVKGAIDRAGIKPEQVDEVYLGNVIAAGLGQAPARQAALGAGVPTSAPCTTVNKVCASGMKAIMLAAQNVATGQADVMVAGGFESMSNVPFVDPTRRGGNKLGDAKVHDGLLHDGLTNVYDGAHMGNCAEKTSADHNVSREDQDAFALESYARAAKAYEGGKFAAEITPVEVPQRRGDAIVVDEDEEYKNLRADKVPTLRPAFQKDGAITAANASKLNDGASAMVIMSADKAAELGVKPLARILGFADAACEPVDFGIAPSLAVPKALKAAGVSASDVDFVEINEAFSVVAIANAKELGFSLDKVNVYGGAVALGHPIGSSGSRITGTLLSVLRQEGGKIGVAGICNGGGGASAIVVENMQ